MTMEQIKKDVVVVGGGPGGFAAAVTAARAGAQVLLVERNGYLGGQLGSGLPFLAFWDIKGRQVVGGQHCHDQDFSPGEIRHRHFK